MADKIILMESLHDDNNATRSLVIDPADESVVVPVVGRLSLGVGESFLRLYLPEKADWLVPYMHELTTFPNGNFDDQVGSTSQALDWVRSGDRYCYGLLEYHKQVIAGTIKSPEASSIFLRPRTFRD